MNRSDILIIGGGVIGAALAYELSMGGARVQLLERQSVASGASGMSAAMLEAQLDARETGPFTELALASRALFPTLASELRHQTSVDIGYEACGILQIASNEAESLSLQARYEWQQRRAWPVEWLSSNEVQRRLPGWSGRNYGGIFYAGDGQVIASRFTSALAEVARKRGVTFGEGVSVTGFQTAGHHVTSVETTQGYFEADQIVVAAGPWSSALVECLGFDLPVEPIRGQLLQFKTPHRFLPYPVYFFEGYITPKADGTTLVGSTVERVGFSSETSPEGIEQLQAMVLKRFPSLASQPYLGAVAGLRPGGMPDNLPAIGPLPDWDNVSIATGHYRNGILLAPITAKLLAAHLLKQPSPLSLDPFLPARLLAEKPLIS